MKKMSHLSIFVALLASLAMLFPPQVAAQAQSAGKIARLIPTVNLQHGTRVHSAAAGAQVVWGDMVSTDPGGRARITLDDGSILNVGSNSSIRIVQHDAANQRTQIDLAYGRLRSSAVKLARAGSSFEVRTPTAVAGVVGTDFQVEHENDISSVHVFEGKVNWCNRKTGACVIVLAGFSSSIRGNNSPESPQPTLPSTGATSMNSTSVGTGGGAGAGGAAAGGAAAGAAATHSVLVIATAIAAAAIPAVVVPVATKGKKCGCNTVGN
jgi:hypothetical protein